MVAKVDFFRVGDGDMTLIRLESGRTILIDCNIRNAADDENEDAADVAKQLKDLLGRDSDDRPFVDAMLLSHPDQDHCRGLERHFHLGLLADYAKGSEKIVIREMWSSPIVFRRASKDHTLCSDADAWCKEARRRIRTFRSQNFFPESERVLILGEDIGGKTENLGTILVKIDETWDHINGSTDSTFSALLIAPLNAKDDEEEDLLSKNDSSTIARFQISADGVADACRFLTGGDAGVAVWERVWDRNKGSAAEKLGYDMLLAPHHCSWRSLSWDSWSENGERAQVSQAARDALGQARSGATIVASSKTITDDDADPPCIRAEREYKDLLRGVRGTFVCVGDGGPDPLAYDIEPGGARKRPLKAIAAAILSPAVVGSKPVPHG